MKPRYLIPAILLLAGGVAAWFLFRGDPEPELPLPPWTPDHEVAAQANNRFAFDLYAKLRAEPGNLFVSPVCLHANLTAAADGSAGTTRDELLAALYLPKDKPVGDLSAYYSAPRTGFELKVASAAWGEKTVPWKADFLARTPGFRTADFVGNPAAERNAINRWVSDQTAGQIPTLVPEAAVNGDTRYVGANAVYFKAGWKVKFDPALTGPGTFTRADGSKVQTPMMSFGTPQPFKATYDGADPEILEFPYQGEEMSLLLVMPRKHDGLPALEAKLSIETLNRWTSLSKTPMRLTLPKFRHEWRPASGDLRPTLKALGIRTVFDPTEADFSPMTAEKLWLGAVHSAAVVDVNEEGTTAAAASSWGMGKSDVGHFIADHPFLYLIRDTKRGTILFLGRFETP